MSFIDDLLVGGHPAVIHFPIIGILMGMVASVTALAIGIFLDIFDARSWLTDNRKEIARNFIDRFEFTSWIMIFMGWGGLIIAGYTGYKSVGTQQDALSSNLLVFKIKLSIYVFFLLLVPLSLKLYLALVKNRAVFGDSRIIPLMYIIPMIVAAILTVLISGAGGRYVYGHSILDNVGLGWIFPEG